jgi:hypothetical protein
MSITNRQNRLLVSEDWKRVYQSFRNAEFQSYDFDNIRRTMINYLRENYPEDFNDYIESSEYLALIDMMAFLGQNIAFRIDLNARENYLELAERRESVLRLARLLSYNPKRNQAANGLLKIDSVSTTETVRDSNNLNLANQSIVWNDPSNTNWNEQFQRVLNAALPDNNKIGSPAKAESVNGVPTEQYKLNGASNAVPTFSFTKAVDGRSLVFELVSTDINNGTIKEEPPLPGNDFGFIYRNDGQGPASSNTGYFCHFRQGTLDLGNFSITNPSTNQVAAIDETNINESDIWLYSVDDNGTEQELWTRVDAVEGNNVIYNSIAKDQRNIYSVLTRVEDRISLIFADGTFGNLPDGSFRVYYRTSANSRILIKPQDMRNIAVRIPYISKSGRAETLTITCSLKYTVDNATVSETNDSIRTNAPSTYYTQNRMVTGEDYQIAPLSLNQEIIKVKSVNRTSSGISRYFDLIDPSGKYSSTNIFASDGALYKEYREEKIEFDFQSITEVEGIILNRIEPLFEERNVYNFYLDQFPRVIVRDLGNTWNEVLNQTNSNSGFFTNAGGLRSKVSGFASSNLQFVRTNSLIKLEAPEGQYFFDGKLLTGTPGAEGGRTSFWTKVLDISGDGTQETATGIGPIVLGDSVPSGAILAEIITQLPNSLTEDIRTQTIDQIFSYRTFGIRYDRDTAAWQIITQNNLNLAADFSIGKAGDVTDNQLDSSWFIAFETNGENYTVTYRTLRYIFESDQEVRFFYDSSDNVFDVTTGKTIKDRVSVLNINTQPDSTQPFNRNFDWEIVKEYRDELGYVDSKKIEVSFFDSDNDGIVDSPDTFEEIVNENTQPANKIVFLESVRSNDGVNDFVYASRDDLNIRVFAQKTEFNAIPKSQIADGQLLYFVQEDVFEMFDATTNTTVLDSRYRARVGRDGLRFQYFHSADQNARIDPGVSNIIDVYMLTRSYDLEFREWLSGARNIKPLPPSNDSLFVNFGQELNKIKSISDEIIYQPVKYKVLFGAKADTELQATFKIVKNPDLVINDNELKSRVIRSINRYFAIDNWDFGDTFYFSELAAYVINENAPDLTSFVIVPVEGSAAFGSLYEIKSESNEIFISGATVADIELIDELTATELRTQGSIITETSSVNTGIQSSSLTSSQIGGMNTNGY